MILTVTLNPAVDRTVYMNALHPGQVNVIEKVVKDPGGKGINVSRFMKKNGKETLAMGLLAGTSGQWIQSKLDQLDIASNFTWIDGETRTNEKIVSLSSGETTDLNEKGPLVQETDTNRFLESYSTAIQPNQWIVLAGSLPKGIPASFYTSLVNEAKKKGAKVALDINGDLLKDNPKVQPDFIKPNKEELEALVGKKLSTNEEIRLAVQPLLSRGIERVCVSLGADGSLFIDKDQMIQVSVPKVQVLSTVGAGDSLVAGYVWAMDSHLSLEECVKIAAAASVIAVTKEGTDFATNAEIDKILPHLQIKQK